MKNRSLALALLLVSLASPLAISAQELTLKMGANVPINSPWDLGLKRLASEFARVSGGRIKIVFPQTAHVSTESDIIQKMKLGLDGAVLTTFGIAELYPDSLALSMPSFIRNDAEFDAVLQAVEPLIKAKLGDRYVFLAINKGGWVRYFSRNPIVTPADLVNIRVSINPSDVKVMQLMQSVGSRTIKGTTADFILQINSNTVDACTTSPIYIASLWSQLRGKVGYMTSFKVAPFVGAIVFNKSSWDKVPAELRPQLEKVVKDVADKIEADTSKLEADAIAALDGIKSPPITAEDQAKWNALIEDRRETLIAQLFSADILTTMDQALAKARKAK